MPVERSLWKPWFANLPAWGCPTCGKGHLKIVKETKHDQDTGPSNREKGHDAWDPSWIRGRFVALLECDFASCKEVASISGNYCVDVDVTFNYNGEPDETWATFYEVLSISPPPLAISSIKSCPEKVNGALARASALLWQSAEAAANNIRQAVEHLMDARKIKEVVTRNGKQTRLSLHARIEEFAKNDAENGAILLALKWLGNSGSHVDGLTRENVLDAFDMVELALDNLYGTTKATIMKKVKAINKIKGPAKP